MSAEEDDSSSTAAVLMKYDSMEIEDEADALSLRSMPLQKDDDYFYYHCDGGKEDDEDEETVDHIGLLIGPASAQYPVIIKAEEMRLSLRSTASEVTIDECDSLEEKDNLGTYTTHEFIDMKLQIADLKEKLDSQLLQHHSTISSLRDRIMSLENENVDLRQKLKESEDASSRERVEARRVERLLQDKVESLAKEVQLCQDRKHHDRAMRRRTSTREADDVRNEPEEDYLPFPESRDSHKAEGRRPSLLESLRQSLRRTSNDSDRSIPKAISSNSLASEGMSTDDLDSHYSWANADEINAQTGIFNQKSITKLLVDAAKKDCEKPVCSSRRNSTTTSSLRHSTMTSQQSGTTYPRVKEPRRKSFTLGEKSSSLKRLLSKRTAEESSFDVESELWDNFDEKPDLDDISIKTWDYADEEPGLDISTKTEKTANYTVGW